MPKRVWQKKSLQDRPLLHGLSSVPGSMLIGWSHGFLHRLLPSLPPCHGYDWPAPGALLAKVLLDHFHGNALARPPNHPVAPTAGCQHVCNLLGHIESSSPRFPNFGSCLSDCFGSKHELPRPPELGLAPSPVLPSPHQIWYDLIFKDFQFVLNPNWIGIPLRCLVWLNLDRFQRIFSRDLIKVKWAEKMWYACSPPKPFIPPVFYPRLHYRCTSTHCPIQLLHKCRVVQFKRTNRTHPSFGWKYSFTRTPPLYEPSRDPTLLDWRKRRFYLLSNLHKPFMERYKDLINACLQLNNQWKV